MSLSLHSLTLDQQVSTPTPGSPHPYIPVDNHDRLNSIQLSSDASGEFSVAHSPRSLMGGPPGEGLSELRNAHNPPWLHGLTGTPPSILGLHRADRAGRWVEDARRFPEQTIDFRAHANLARLSLGHGLISTDSNRALSSLPHSPVLALQDSFSRPARDAASNKGLRHKPSPFDKPFHNAKAGDGLDRHEYDSLKNPQSALFKHQDGLSGDGSSEEGEAWPMPETPFMSHDVWNGNTHRKQFSKPADKLIASHNNPSALSPEIHKGVNPHRKPVNGGARANVMANGKPTVKEGERRVGRCKMYNCDKGVGFLIDDRLDQVPHDVKIHWTDIFSDQEFKSLAKGEIVEYTLNITANGFSASYVTGPGGRSVMGAEQAIVQASRQTSYKLFKAGALPVKTYRSKWETILSPGASDGSPAQTSNSNSKEAKLEAAPKVNSAFGQSFHASKSNTSPPTGKPQEIIGDVASLEKKDAMSLGRERYSNGHGRVLGSLNSANHFNTPAWSSLRSPMGYMQSPNLANGFAGSTPLPALSPSVVTPHSAETFNAVFPGGYTPHNMASLRTPNVTIATPSDATHSFMNNRLLSGSQPGVNQTDLQSFLEQRQMLLQQQALLMSMYQNTTQSTPASSVQAFTRNSTSKQPAAQPYYGSFEKASHALDPKFQYLGLLPPIALPAIKEVPKLSDLMHKQRGNGPWRVPDLVEVNVEATAAGLRASAETFTPAGSTSPNVLTPEGQVKDLESDSLRKTGSPVYQIPGRRSVSDPAAAGAPGGKKINAHVQKTQNLNTNPHIQQYRPAVDKVLSQKRVTFAEHVIPTRRVVSHGEVIGTPVPRESILEDCSSEAGEESYDISADSSFTSAQNVEKALLEEVRKVGNVKSVDLALERLREAAGSAATLSLKKPVTIGVGSANKEEDVGLTIQDGSVAQDEKHGKKMAQNPAHVGTPTPAGSKESCEGLDSHHQPQPKLSLMIQEAVVPITHKPLQT